MDEIERRTSYIDERILIKSERILNPQFAQAVLYFTGAQIELLRNVMDYLNRRTSFVSEYYSQYYLVPDDSDWDAISAIVADIEEVIMGNDNIIFGYSSPLRENLGDICPNPGTYSSLTGAVPAGELWRVEFVTLRNMSGARGPSRITAVTTVGETVLAFTPSPVEDVPIEYSGVLTLVEGDRIGVYVQNCQTDDIVDAEVLGYRMTI